VHSWPEALPVLLNAAQTRARPQARLQAAGLVRHHAPWWATAITAKGTLPAYRDKRKFVLHWDSFRRGYIH